MLPSERPPLDPETQNVQYAREAMMLAQCEARHPGPPAGASWTGRSLLEREAIPLPVAVLAPPLPVAAQAHAKFAAHRRPLVAGGIPCAGGIDASAGRAAAKPIAGTVVPDGTETVAVERLVAVLSTTTKRPRKVSPAAARATQCSRHPLLRFRYLSLRQQDGTTTSPPPWRWTRPPLPRA